MKKYRDFIILIILTMGLQALLYFLIKCFINDYHLINSIINVPLIKPFIYFYDSWYPFIIICAFIVYKDNKNLFYKLILSMLLCGLLAHLTFIIYPTMVERPTIIVHNITDWLLNFTYQTDSPPVNCLPSVHCIYCFLIIFYIIKSNIKPIKKYIIVIYSFLIVLSTIFVHQHIIEDVLFALLYIIISIIIVNIFTKKTP